jgi:hypothetical protein
MRRYWVSARRSRSNVSLRESRLLVVARHHILDVGTQFATYIVAHGLHYLFRDVHFSGGYVFEYNGVEFLSHCPHLLDDIVAARRYEEPLDSSVDWIGSSFDLTAGFESVDQATDGDLSHLELACQIALNHSFRLVARQVCKCPPLGPR